MGSKLTMSTFCTKSVQQVFKKSVLYFCFFMCSLKMIIKHQMIVWSNKVQHFKFGICHQRRMFNRKIQQLNMPCVKVPSWNLFAFIEIQDHNQPKVIPKHVFERDFQWRDLFYLVGQVVVQPSSMHHFKPSAMPLSSH